MPLFGSTFSPKKIPPRKSASLSSLHTLDRSTREVELGLEYGPPVMNLGGQSWKFEDGQWISGKRSHKGRGKQFSNPEEIDRQMKAQKELEENPGAAEKGSDADSDEESSSDEENDSRKRSGVEGLIEIENPNRVSQKSKKVAELDVNAPRELSRREREEIEKQKSKERYMKLHLEGKTDQARADLARLAIIKKQREDAAKKRDDQKKESEDSKTKR
ncbi:hypothetical protein JOQ06_026448 [Pogonophryne albipinna]|uniref:Casein kinase substrate phosphoprotein PP28 domain-containing protein n=1 Tax=Pogonophryne albipinna TaxID=1090488 RepID=A0AAD6BB15_9TELE|nr:hypothetical protein JOQ06_026448 [Pogonophryne albipinna]